MYITKSIEYKLTKKIKRYIKGTDPSFKDHDSVLTNGCTILKECDVKKISKKIAIVDKRIKEPRIYRHGFFGCIVMLPSITKTNQICHITRLKPDTLIIESESTQSLINYIKNKVCNISLKKIILIDNDNSFQKQAPQLIGTGKADTIERVVGLQLIEYKEDVS